MFTQEEALLRRIWNVHWVKRQVIGCLRADVYVQYLTCMLGVYPHYRTFTVEKIYRHFRLYTGVIGDFLPPARQRHARGSGSFL